MFSGIGVIILIILFVHYGGKKDGNFASSLFVTGLVGLYPVGGVAWAYLQYAIALPDGA
jgi:hypothetical protein